jgi:amyloid beta precursor protein binding protein 1
MATNDKYDRQLRLWGAQGQRALGETKVVAVGTSAAGTETLKNLILPGIGAFCVMGFVDSNDGGEEGGEGSAAVAEGELSSSVTNTGAITEQDAVSNFFLPKQQVQNLTKAEGACKYLKELNPDVNGSYRNLSLSIKENGGPESPNYWKQVLEEETETTIVPMNQTKHVLVIASDLVPSVLEALADACYGSGQPLIVVTSYGLIGCVRLQLPKEGHPILQPKPTNSPPDLRLVTSFPAFREYVESIAGGDSLEKMDSQQHGHVPYPVLLAKAMEEYRKANADANADANSKWREGSPAKILPKTFSQKQDFVNNYVKPMARDCNMELNFQEAISSAYLAYAERDLMWLDEPAPEKGSKLGQLRTTLEAFLKEHPDHRPPINGSVPDMTASTNLYVRLQQLYKDQAQEDLEKMTDILRKQQEAYTDSESSYEIVTDEDIANFCANVYSVGHLQTRSLKDEYNYTDETKTNDEELVDDWKMALMDPYEVPVHTPFLWYLGFRACQDFCHNEGRYPGCVEVCGDGPNENKNALEKDASRLLEILREAVLPNYKLSLSDEHSDPESPLNETNMQKICRELTRYGNAEVHTVSSVVGGVASQEAVKIITGQYVPLNNTYIYNGIVSVGGVYRF